VAESDVPVWATTLEGQNCERPTQFAHAIIQFALCIMENKYTKQPAHAVEKLLYEHAFYDPFLLRWVQTDLHWYLITKEM
jgi:hypothetical protein